MLSKNKRGFSLVLQIINIVPLFFFGLIITIASSHWFTKAMYNEVEVELANAAHDIDTLLDVAYPGDYTFINDTSSRLYKGDHDLTSDYSLVDRFKNDTDMDITLFYNDTRILTTISDFSGTRFVGTAAPEIIIENVLNTGEAHFYHNIFIGTNEYFAYYMPLRNSDTQIVGMIFVGKPTDQVDTAIRNSVYPLALVSLMAMISIAILVFFYTKKVTSALVKIRYFLSDVASGNLNADLDASILKRNDELGDIGHSALTMQRSIRQMIELDTLTELWNRRSGDRKIKQTIEQFVNQKIPFCLAIGDIDFFKKVNDTYGHNCGDVILKKVADKLRTHMYNCGYAVRWGGEEFLLIFDHSNLEESQCILENTLNDIRSMETVFDGQIIKITMTFGLVNGLSTDVKQLIQQADAKLYEGKEAGRNRIIT